jgi:hypothetical protein
MAAAAPHRHLQGVGGAVSAREKGATTLARVRARRWSDPESAYMLISWL